MKVSQDRRTEEEKQHLRRVLATMKCFRKYPSVSIINFFMLQYFNFVIMLIKVSIM